MTNDAELEAQIRARDAEDYETGLDVAGWDRRTLLRLLDEARGELADSRRREQEARDAWVAMRAQRDRVLAERDGLLRMLDEARANAEGWRRARDSARADAQSFKDDLNEEAHQFQNFHHLLCGRFGYGHDPVDWRRDQLSLIEHIAARHSKAEAEIERLRNIAMTVKGIISSNIVEYDDVRNAIDSLEAALSPPPSETP